MNSAQTNLKLEEGRYETGIDPYVDVLIAQTTVLANMQTLNNFQVEADDRCGRPGAGSGRRLGRFAVAESRAGRSEAGSNGDGHPEIGRRKSL